MILKLNEEYMDLVWRGAKNSTIRSGHRKVTVGERLILRSDRQQITVTITAARHVRMFDLTSEDARGDGFQNLGFLLEALRKIYGELEASDPLTIIEWKRDSV